MAIDRNLRQLLSIIRTDDGGSALKKFSILFFFFCSICFAQPYIVDFPDPLRTVTAANNAELTAALVGAIPGDLILLKDGSTFSGQFTVAKAGTESNPIIIRSAGHSILNGGFKITAERNYIWGVEITAGSFEGITLFCKNCGAINNVIHEQANGNIGIGAWNYGAGQIIYGNIVWKMISNGNNPHNIYSQNSYDANGYKYFVANYVADPAPTGNTFLFHAYGQQTYISGYWLERNIFANGTALVGSQSALQPDHHQVWKDNYFWNGAMRNGYNRPTWFTATGNYFGKSLLVTQRQWGTPEVVYPALAASGTTIFKGNTIAFPSGQHIQLVTYSYADACQAGQDPACPRKEGVNIRPDNDFDGNTYIPDFKASLTAGTPSAVAIPDITTWRVKTAAAGKQFDTNSVVKTTEPTKQFFIQNEYDSTLGFLVVYNWQSLPSISFAKAGAIEVRKVKDPFGAPVISGKDSVTVPLTGEFETFLVKTVAPAIPQCDWQAIEQKRIQALAVLNDPNLKQGQKIKMTRNILNEQGILLTSCLP